MGIYGVFCWFYTCFEQKRNPKIITITIAGLFSRKMIHIGNQIGFPNPSPCKSKLHSFWFGGKIQIL